MSDSKFPTLAEQPEHAQEPTTDLSPRDLAKISEFKMAGAPGVTALKDTDLERIMDLYLTGKTYSQIARIMRLERTLLMYLSDRFKWYDLRRSYLSELEGAIRGRVIESKIASKDFLLQLTHMWEKKIGKKLETYLRTDNEAFADEIDLKEVDKYLKTVEILHRLTSEKSDSRPHAPAVGLNLGDGVTVKKVGDTVEITPKQATIGSVLKQFADLRREEEIKKSDKKNQGEKNEA